MAGDKVRCAVCKHQINAFCVLKKCKVALNKRRKCNKFKIEPRKVRLKNEIPTTRVPHREVAKRQRQEYKKKLKRAKALGLDQYNVAVTTPPKKVSYTEDLKSGAAIKTNDPKYPLTGDLSRFTSTADKKE